MDCRGESDGVGALVPDSGVGVALPAPQEVFGFGEVVRGLDAYTGAAGTLI